MITAGAGASLADFGLAAGAAGAGAAGTPSALSFSVTELLMASTSEFELLLRHALWQRDGGLGLHCD